MGQARGRPCQRRVADASNVRHVSIQPDEPLVQQQDHWPRTTLSDAETAATISIRIRALQPREVPPALNFLVQWLSDHNLSNTFEVLGFYDRERDSDSVPVELRERYDAIFKSVEAARNRRNADEPDIWKGDAKPLFLVQLRALASRDEIGEIEAVIAAKGGVSLWDRVLRKISMQTNIPSRRIVIDVPVYCAGSEVFEVRPGVADRVGSVCAMSSAATSISVSPGQLASAVLEKMTNNISLSDAIAEFLPTFLSMPGNNIQYLTKNAEFVDVIVRGLRGHIIKGGSEWEKLEISVVRTGVSEVRFLADGMLASGVGSYPPDSQFTKSIEAGNAQDLTLFTKTLATAFGDYVRKAGQR